VYLYEKAWFLVLFSLRSFSFLENLSYTYEIATRSLLPIQYDKRKKYLFRKDERKFREHVVYSRSRVMRLGANANEKRRYVKRVQGWK